MKQVSWSVVIKSTDVNKSNYFEIILVLWSLYFELSRKQVYTFVINTSISQVPVGVKRM